MSDDPDQISNRQPMDNTSRECGCAGLVSCALQSQTDPLRRADNHGADSGRRSYSFRSAFLFLQWLAIKLAQGILIVFVIIGSAIFFPSLALAIMVWDWVTKPERTFAEKINEVRTQTHS